MILTLLGRIGIITSQMLREKRRYFIVVVFVIAAVLTPPDVISQLSLAIPLLILYEGSISSVQMVEKKAAAAASRRRRPRPQGRRDAKSAGLTGMPALRHSLGRHRRGWPRHRPSHDDSKSLAMHDIKWIREHPDGFDRGLQRRGLERRWRKRVLALDEHRRAAIPKLGAGAGAPQRGLEGDRRRPRRRRTRPRRRR